MTPASCYDCHACIIDAAILLADEVHSSPQIGQATDRRASTTLIDARRKRSSPQNMSNLFAHRTRAYTSYGDRLMRQTIGVSACSGTVIDASA